MGNAIEVLSSGLSAARLRMNVIASNLANAETTRTEEGGPYKRKDVVQIARTSHSQFDTILDRMTLSRPEVLAVVEDQKEAKKVFEPGHPDADEKGYVQYPNINIVTEMTNMLAATQNYRASVAAVEAARDMATEASRISGTY